MNMKITVLGATGNAGSRVVAEAQSRGHEVTAVVRTSSVTNNLPAGIKIITGDAGNVADVSKVSAGQDLVISAIRPASGHESDINSTTRSLMDGLAQTGVRLLVVGGAATLTVPGTDAKTVLEDSDYLPVSARHIGKASADQFEVCLAETRVDWAYLSPAAQFAPGERTGNFRLGTDELLVDAEGISKISMEDLAVVLLDEAERPRHHRTRFTAAY
jgi:putative NADH-flavin reductase